MSLRDPEFGESLDGFIATSSLSEEKKLPKQQVRDHHVILYSAHSNKLPEAAGRNYTVMNSFPSVNQKLLTYIKVWELLQVA